MDKIDRELFKNKIRVCAVCGAALYHSRLHGSACSVNPAHKGIAWHDPAEEWPADKQEMEAADGR